MRLRGLVFERFGAFERAEANLCDADGVPLDVVIFVGEAGAGKSALLRGVSGILAEAAGAESELDADDVRRGADSARCRVVFDDVVDDGRIVVTLEKEIAKTGGGSLRASPADAFQRWRGAVEREDTPRAAFSIASGDDGDDEVERTRFDLGSHRDPLVDWFAGLRRATGWEEAVAALDRVLWPYQVHHVDDDGDVIFSAPSGEAAWHELGDAFGSVLVIALELLRLSTDRPTEELVYVIDDIDAHLHPRIEARLLGDLRRAFPRVQLIATTHSPFIVASVEPEQVFRIERAPGGVVRLSDRVQRGAAATQVMDLAFGAPELPGPRWTHTPPLGVRKDLLRAVEADLTRGAVVYALSETIHVKEVRNAFGEPVLPGTESVVGHLIFVDRAPGSSWGHDCEYVFRSRDGRISRQRAIWPPAGLDRFIPIARG